MSFEWKCQCGETIIVPFADSPQQMSGFSYCVCEECYKKALKQERTYYETEEEFHEWTKKFTQDNGLPYFITPENGTYACKTKEVE